MMPLWNLPAGENRGSMENRILVCDDEEGMRRYLGKMLGSWGYQVDAFASPLALIKRLEDTESPADLVLLDIKMPELDGIEALRRVKQARPAIPVVMMTGHGTIESAVEAMKLGAYDYLAKPFPQEKLYALVQHCLEGERLRQENSSLKKELRERVTPDPPVFQSPRFAEVYDLALRVAETDSSVLILGESGTGKELIAGAIHYSSPRSGNRFLAINCAALSEHLLESQLFGHVKGAFTGAVQAQKGFIEEADRGTLFLDEIGDLSPSLQAKLLRVLQEGQLERLGSTRPIDVDARVIAASNRNLASAVKEGRFREDLYYRLNVFPIAVPPLRERREDIPLLAWSMVKEFGHVFGKTIERIPRKNMEALERYPWPGNVRELRNMIERAMILSNSPTLCVELPDTSSAPASSQAITLEEMARAHILSVMEKSGWRVRGPNGAAAILGLKPTTLDSKMKKLGIHRKHSSELP